MLHHDPSLFEQVILRVSEDTGIEASIIEKDYYVTLFLQRIVAHQPNIIFKGGTSLSKCYKLINRFSEDIDLNIDTESHHTEGQRRKLKEAIVSIIEEFGFALTNPDKVRSRRDYNRYVVDYPTIFPTSYLKEHLPGKKCYVFGTASFYDQLLAAGIPVTRDREDGVEVLLCGFDTELTFQKLEDACILLQRGVDFVATNPDWVCPTWYGSVPDCGSVCEMLHRATGRRPKVIGKPQPEMALLAMERFGYAKEQTMMVGDRLYTDIACGVAAGIHSLLVLSGESTMKDAEESDVKPEFIMKDCSELLEKIR